MSRLISIMSVILLLAGIIQPAQAFNPIPENPRLADAPGYRLNSEGDEWVWTDPAQHEPKPPAPQAWAQGMSQEMLPPASPLAASAQVGVETALGAALDQAREAGPQAVLDFIASQPDQNHPLLQAARLDAQHELSAGVPARPDAPAAPRVSLNSSPCGYETIQEAVTAAADGDTVRVAAGVYSETVNIDGVIITIQGGYDANCANLVGGVTEVRANVAGSVVDVTGGAVVNLLALSLTGGSSFGAGVDVLGTSRVTLNGTDVYNNNGAAGAGIYIGGTSVVTYTNDSDIYNNISSSAGGGAIVYGRLSGFDTTSDVYGNTALDGGGLYVSGGDLILDNADVVANVATQNGGGIFVSSGAITLTNSVFVGETGPCCQSAAAGGGIYADNSRVALLGAETSVINNTATGNGVGIYLTNNSILTATGGSLGYDSTSTAGNDAVLGAGLYTINSTVSFSGRILNNIASNSGGGIYADTSTILLDGATIGGVNPNEHNQIGPLGLNGAGLYLINNTRADIASTVIVSNTLSNSSTGYAGGLYVRAGSLVTMTNSTVQEHFLPSAFDGRGAGMYIYDATVTLSNTQVLSNTTSNLGGGARLFGISTLNILGGSVFRGNRAFGGVGGAIAATNSADINANHAVFSANTASSHGGAIYLDSGTLDFTGAWDVSFNQAGGNGGAVAVTGTGNAGFFATGGQLFSYLAGNHADGSGGGVYTSNPNTIELHATSGSPLYLSDNSAGADGGALYANGSAFFDIYGDIRASSNAATGNGGLAYLSGGSRMWLDDYFDIPVQVLDNTAASGGAIYAEDSPRVECDGTIMGIQDYGNDAQAGSGGAIHLSGSTFTADNCTFSSNQAQGGDGGAIAAYTSTVTIDVDYPLLAADNLVAPDSPRSPSATACNPRARQCSRLSANSASGSGGAIYANASELVVNQSYLHHNTAQSGGAIYQGGAGAAGTISNTLVYSNTSLLALGAGIRAQSGAMTIRHATLANNTGGAGYSPGAVQSYIYNTIIWGNTVAAFGTLTEAECNIDQGGTAGPVLDPLFISPGGGENYRLQEGSPAIDACTYGLPTDLLSIPRPQRSQYDTGAFEMPEPAYLEIAHLAPFASSLGTAVTITQYSDPLLTGFSFADSTGYLTLDSGESSIEVWPAGASSPAITATLNLTPYSENSLIAAGDDTHQPLELLALVDDNTPPPAGMFHLRVGHLMAFESGSAQAELRLQDGTLLLPALSYGEVSVYLPLEAGSYDLKVTAPGGLLTLVDPLPVTFTAGQVVSVYAVGDGINQPLGVFAWNAGEPGALLPLAEYGVSLSPAADAKEGSPGQTVVYTLQITNTGDTRVDFAITYTATWGVYLPITSITLDPGGFAELEARVTIPSDAADGDSDVATITATATDFPSASAQALLTTTAAQRRIFLPVVLDGSQVLGQ